MSNKPDHLLVYTLFGVIVCAYLIMAIWFPMAYIWATYEDLVGEWIQFWFFVTALLYSAKLALSQSKFRLFFAILALCCFYAAMEEISWGQRILDIASPDFFKRYNIQKETNIHNLFVGPIGTVTKRIIQYSLAAALVIYGLIYPFALKRHWHLATRLESFGLASPPIYLWPFFVLGAFLELPVLRFNEAEIAEILISFALAVMAMHYWRTHRLQNKDERVSNGQKDTGFSNQHAVSISVMFFAVLFLSGVSTYFSYTSPVIGPRIDNRVLNGVEKFAGRYKRYGHYNMAASLYLQVHREEPHRTSILRKAAACFKEMGDIEKFEFYITMALDKDLERYKRKPRKISLNLSLARTYRQLGKTDKADYHLEKALQIGSNRVKRKPESASAAYWLGKTYSMLNNPAAAAEQYQRASDLNPYSRKYKKALISAKGAISGGKN